MNDMPFHSQPVDRSLNTTASASGADTSGIVWPIMPFAGGAEASGILFPFAPFAGEE